MRRPPRRAFLTATGGIVLAGCFDADGGSPTDDSRPGSGGAIDDTDVPEPENDEYGSGDADDRSLPPAGTAPDGYPDYGVDRLVAFDEIDPDETAIFLEPSAETVEEGDRVTFELHNRSAHRFSHNPYRWIVHKLVDGGWFYVGPREFPEPESRLDPDESRSWELRIENDAVDNGRSIGKPGTIERDPLVGLGGGEYAFGTRGGFVGDTYDGSIGFSARFELEADDLELTATDELTDVEWEGDTLVANPDRARDEGAPIAFELVRTDDDVVGEPVITETLLRDDRLRDAVALSREYDAGRVRLEESDASSYVWYEDGHYEYEGETYAVSTRDLEE
ncbi:hypothetical protein [Natrialba swarupiae]|uniref:Uncharacterized protein n=1 Tax=Natrialba swarupiae TaxID=2448032 RepID=A0A5D5AP46_9EURY|nr:hypothetical protein [Natrialba swarupiae]TYT62824.1 hypothetical protein FYC77_05760 [Natrialba swarupiae]